MPPTSSSPLSTEPVPSNPPEPAQASALRPADIARHRDLTETAAASLPDGFLAAEWTAPRSWRTFAVADPALGRPVAAVADCEPDDALLALTAANDAFPAWAATPTRRRADILHRLYEAMLADEERLAVLITLEVGKTLAEARGEVRYAAEYVRWYAEEAVRSSGRSTPTPDGSWHIVTVPRPVGPCLLITPWNVPLAMATRKAAPALAAGCTVVLKPAELTPLTTLALAQLAQDAGVPAGVLTVVTTTDPAAVCGTLIADPRLRKVSFTGSTPVGKLLLQQAGAHVLRTSMELGGNAPFLVFDDADLDLAVREAVIAKMRLGGQSCVAANRFLVQEPVADEFAARLTEALTAIRVGLGTSDVDLGPLIDDRAVAKADRLVGDAVAKGATLLGRAGAPDGAGSWFAPVVLDHLSADALLQQEEVFAPVAGIRRFRTEDEGVALANDTPFGLAAYLVARDSDRIARVAGRLDSGMVGINRGLLSHVAAPFGGIKESGIGREGGAEGLVEYQNLKYLAAPALAS
ncbi:NAD-dependent succinate-semialdehyde dehydrogenase [Nonomuraea sp. G32]|nr:NAD-dependent succinate-semialdehyde dehydrogenase [Nonomuraea sp. G32]MDP4511684.1 NAD-dependent succinate-semialdehyde dehydrogenase [Nonomuraea sp. G32]